MAISNTTKFGVVYTTPAALAANIDTLKDGKLYVAIGATSGPLGQGIYMLDSSGVDADGNASLSMVGAGALASANNAGLLSTEDFVKLSNLAQSLEAKANKSHKHLYTDISTGGTTAGQILVSKTDGTFELKTLSNQSVSNATNASTAEVAKRVDSSLYIKVNNSQKIAYDASDAKTLDISAGSNVTLSWDSSNNRVSIAAKDTTYSNGDGLALSGTVFSHADTTDASADTSFGPTTDASQNAKGTITINVPQIKIDKFGHVSNVSVKTFKVLDTNTDTNTWRAIKVNGTQKLADNVSTALDLSAGTNISLSESGGKVTIATTGVPTTTEMNTAISNAVSSLFKFVGDTTSTPTTATVGQAWRASAAFTLAAANSVTDAPQSIEIGDVLLCTASGPKFTVIQNNITNNVSFSGTPSDTKIVVFDGTTGLVKSSGKSISDFAPASLTNTVDQLGSTVSGKLSASGAGGANKIYASDASGNFKVTNLTDVSVKYATSAGSCTNASTATQVSKTFDISVGGSDVLTYNGSTNKTIAFKGGGITTVSHSDGVITITTSDTNTDTKVTSAANHYTPSADSSVTATASGSTLSFGGAVVTGMTKDSKGHITGFTTSKLPSNPNTDTKVTDASGTSKSFILGHTTQGTNAAATTNASCYMNGGYLYSGGTKVSVEGHTHSYLSSQTWRPIKVNGTQKLANNTSTALDLSAGTNITLSESGGKVTINATDQAIYWEVLTA